MAGRFLARALRPVVVRASEVERGYPPTWTNPSRPGWGTTSGGCAKRAGSRRTRWARLADLPRSTWASLESGAGNPTLSVLSRVAHALQVSLEELISSPHAEAAHYPSGALQRQVRTGVEIRKLLPDPIPGMELDRLALPPASHMTGIPHTPGTREYLACEEGEIVLAVAGERFTLRPGDVVAFRGDQRHSYHNVAARPAVGYSVVVLARLR